MRLAQIGIFAALTISIAVSARGFSAEAPKAPNFLFSEDNQIDHTSNELITSIKPQSHVHNDKWLNEPLPRLDYVLINIQSHLERNSFLSSNISELVKESFALQNGDLPASVEFGVGYSEASGRIFIGGTIDAHGKPKRPMREFCREALSRIEEFYPLKPFGQIWSNTLGLLVRDNDENKYQPIINDLASSAVIKFTVNTAYSSGANYLFFQIGCIKQGEEGPVTFYKYSSVLKRD